MNPATVAGTDTDVPSEVTRVELKLSSLARTRSNARTSLSSASAVATGRPEPICEFMAVSPRPALLGDASALGTIVGRINPRNANDRLGRGVVPTGRRFAVRSRQGGARADDDTLHRRGRRAGAADRDGGSAFGFAVGVAAAAVRRGRGIVAGRVDAEAAGRGRPDRQLRGLYRFDLSAGGGAAAGGADGRCAAGGDRTLRRGR